MNTQITTVKNCNSKPAHHRKHRNHKNASESFGRRLILVDIENACGASILTPPAVHAAKRMICDILSVNKKDLIVIGTSHKKNWLVSSTVWPGPRQLLKEGHDGADIALIEAASQYRQDSFAAVIMVSGDGIFAGIAGRTKAHGKDVTVVASKASLSHRLATAASNIIYLEPNLLPAA